MQSNLTHAPTDQQDDPLDAWVDRMRPGNRRDMFALGVIEDKARRHEHRQAVLGDAESQSVAFLARQAASGAVEDFREHIAEEGAMTISMIRRYCPDAIIDVAEWLLKPIWRLLDRRVKSLERRVDALEKLAKCGDL